MERLPLLIGPVQEARRARKNATEGDAKDVSQSDYENDVSEGGEIQSRLVACMSRHGTEPPTTGGLENSERIVVKIGSALLVDENSGEVRRDWLNSLADDIAELKASRKQVLVVSSGAIAVGRHYLGLPKGPLKLEEKQAAAATGQIWLAHAYQEALARHGITVAQILLSPDDTEERRRHLNARSTLTALLGLGAVPVVNENDTVATEEIRFGDNDRLGARVAQMVSADALILLSDIDGLYTADPRHDPTAAHIPFIKHIDVEVEAIHAGTAGSDYASGDGDEDRRREDRHCRRLPHGNRQRLCAPSAACDQRQYARDMVRGSHHPARRPQELDMTPPPKGSFTLDERP